MLIFTDVQIRTSEVHIETVRCMTVPFEDFCVSTECQHEQGYQEQLVVKLDPLALFLHHGQVTGRMGPLPGDSMVEGQRR